MRQTCPTCGNEQPANEQWSVCLRCDVIGCWACQYAGLCGACQTRKPLTTKPLRGSHCIAVDSGEECEFVWVPEELCILQRFIFSTELGRSVYVTLFRVGYRLGGGLPERLDLFGQRNLRIEAAAMGCAGGLIIPGTGIHLRLGNDSEARQFLSVGLTVLAEPREKPQCEGGGPVLPLRFPRTWLKGPSHE